MVPQAAATMHLPAAVGDYTDFYASRHHAFNVGALFRGPGQELQPNWLHLPVGYHGRSSSLVVSGQGVVRPWGQLLPPGADTPVFTPCRALDFELEMGALIGPGNELGCPVAAQDAWRHLFGLVLLNDWSARDVQKWEYVPLGPFLAKSWASQVSPWVVSFDALEPWQVEPPPLEVPVLPYLSDPGEQGGSGGCGGTHAAGADGHTPCVRVAHDVRVAVDLLPAGAQRATRVCASNLRHMYWTWPQMVAHHTCGGCNLRPGDLLGSGTISGPTPDSRACLLEITRGGAQPLVLPAAGGDAADTSPAGSGAAEAGSGSSGSSGATLQRKYLEDGDEVIIRGWCEGKDGLRIGFGECRGVVLPARAPAGGK